MKVDQPDELIERLNAIEHKTPSRTRNCSSREGPDS
jgi:hypothetical protein